MVQNKQTNKKSLDVSESSHCISSIFKGGFVSVGQGAFGGISKCFLAPKRFGTEDTMHTEGRPIRKQPRAHTTQGLMCRATRSYLNCLQPVPSSRRTRRALPTFLQTLNSRWKGRTSSSLARVKPPRAASHGVVHLVLLLLAPIWSSGIRGRVVWQEQTIGQAHTHQPSLIRKCQWGWHRTEGLNKASSSPATEWRWESLRKERLEPKQLPHRWES